MADDPTDWNVLSTCHDDPKRAAALSTVLTRPSSLPAYTVSPMTPTEANPTVVICCRDDGSMMVEDRVHEIPPSSVR